MIGFLDAAEKGAKMITIPPPSDLLQSLPDR
jgi:hypothetical protein